MAEPPHNTMRQDPVQTASAGRVPHKRLLRPPKAQV